jgi:transposase
MEEPKNENSPVQDKLKEMVASLKAIAKKMDETHSNLVAAKARNQRVISSTHNSERTMDAHQSAHKNRIEGLLEAILDISAANLEANITTMEMGRLQLSQGVETLTSIEPDPHD